MTKVFSSQPKLTAMNRFMQLVTKFSCPSLWRCKLFGKEFIYYGGDTESFLQEFEKLEDQIIELWNTNQLTWNEYQNSIAEIQDAKQQFAWFAY